jgi:predicted metal-dependent peptidase
MESVFRICKKLLIKEPFYGLFLLNINKRYSDRIETAAVAVEGINPVLLINKEFWKGLSEDMAVSILKHECSHLMFGHLTEAWAYLRKENMQLLNIAADNEVNSYIPALQTDPYCYPARYGMENGKGTLFYYDKLRQMQNDQGKGPGSGQSSDFGQTIDDHSTWEEMTDAERQLVQQQIDRIAKQTAEQVQRNQGTIPGQFRDYIDELFKVKPRIFDWKSYFRRYLGSVLDVELRKSRKRENIRFPDASGTRHKRKSQIFVVVDTSGSISPNDLCDFFSEIHHIYKAGAVIDICEIDTKIQRIYRYDGKWDLQAHGRGGTILSDAITHVNDHRRDYTSCVIFTDGYCDVDFKIYVDTMWIIASGGCEQKYPGHCCYIKNSGQN